MSRFPSSRHVEQLLDVTAVEVVGNFRLRLTFEDGTVGDVDFSAGAPRRHATPALEIECGVVGGEEDAISAAGVPAARLYTTDDLLRVAELLGTGERGRYLLAATFGNVHGLYAPGRVKLRRGKFLTAALFPLYGLAWVASHGTRVVSLVGSPYV